MNRIIMSVLCYLMLLILASACTDDSIKDNSANRQIVITVTMPEGNDYWDGNSDGPRKVALSQKDGTLNLIAKWKDSDVINMYVKWGNKVYTVEPSMAKNISGDGKSCTFTFFLPSEVKVGVPYSQFEVFGLCDVEGMIIEDNNDFVVAKSELRRVCWNDDKDTFAPIWFHYTGSETGIHTTFKHLGTYEVLHIKNETSSPVTFQHWGFDVENPWYKCSDRTKLDENYDPTNYFVEPGDEESNTTTIAAGATGRVLSWYIPSGAKIQNAKLQTHINGKLVISSNTKSSNVTIQRGHVYHMYATWDGNELKFDDGDIDEHGSAEMETFTVNGVSFNMVAVEGGTFMMGAHDDDTDAGSDEKPAHQVTLNDYYIGQTEVTQELWLAVMGSNPSNFTGDSRLPVETVSFNDCQTFINKLNSLTGKKFRLPTEAEWEFATTGGMNSKGYKYSGGNNIDDVAWYSNNAYSVGTSSPDYGTHYVGTKFPNELGIFDMSGNVWEWCQDWYSSSYYSNSPNNNPQGPSEGSFRVLRGGSWGDGGNYCRVSSRFSITPDLRYLSIGLRLALTCENTNQEDATGSQEGGTGSGTFNGGSDSGSGSGSRLRGR